MGLKWEPFAAQGQSLTGILCFPPSCQTSGVSHNAFYWSSGCLISIFHLTGRVPYSRQLRRNGTTVVYPKRRLTPQYPKHCRFFSHRGEQRRWRRQSRSLPSNPDVGPWAPMDAYYRLQWKSGVVFTGVNGSPSFGLPPMPGDHLFFFFSQAAERRHPPPKKRGLITSRREAADI